MALKYRPQSNDFVYYDDLSITLPHKGYTMSLRVLADTHIARTIAVQLRRKGVDIVRLEEIPDLPNNCTDAQILEYATEDSRAVLSLDDDFDALHTQWLLNGKSHAGIFRGQAHLQGNIGVIVNMLMEYHELIISGAGSMDDLKDQLVFIR